MGADSGNFLNKQQNKCSKSKTEFYAQYTDLSAIHVNYKTTFI